MARRGLELCWCLQTRSFPTLDLLNLFAIRGVNRLLVPDSCPDKSVATCKATGTEKTPKVTCGHWYTDSYEIPTAHFCATSTDKPGNVYSKVTFLCCGGIGIKDKTVPNNAIAATGESEISLDFESCNSPGVAR